MITRAMHLTVLVIMTAWLTPYNHERSGFVLLCRGVLLRGSMGAITVGLPQEVKDVIKQINSVIRIDILSQIPYGKDLYNGYSISAGSAGVGMLGSGKNLPQLFVVLNDGKYLFSPVCSSDSQCADGSVCW